ncbi:hypothetical protein EI94DRAFT_1700591 [Lactarius quietus]|nr:hypothetical protein EI94DRAFT_1700591 [Lactarius quietus]
MTTTTIRDSYISSPLSTTATLMFVSPKDIGFREVVNRVCRFRVLEKADRVVATSQVADFFSLVLSQTTFMFLDEMGSYLLGARPPGTTQGTLSQPFMFVSSVPFQPRVLPEANTIRNRQERKSEEVAFLDIDSSVKGWVIWLSFSNIQPLLVPLHWQGISTISNQEDMGPRGWVPLTLSSGGRDGLRPGPANHDLDPVAGEGTGLP